MFNGHTKKYFIIGVAFVLVVLTTMILVIISSGKVDVSLVGNEKIKINYNQKYTEQGIVLKKGNKEVKRSKYDVEVSNNVDPHNLGKYEVIYKIKYNHKEYTIKRTIEVSDLEKPNLETNVDTLYRDYCTKENKNNIEYHAVDNYDGDITDKVKIEENEDKITYSVEDSSGNKTEKVIKIQYDDKPDNKFFLNGDEITYVELNREYKELGASYTDGCGNPLEGSIKTIGTVNTKKEGEYSITYILNNHDKLTRKVIVYEKHYAPKTIYLTFDDGPGPYTQSILDTLDKYKVKATFFVTNQFPAYQNMMAEEHKRGHVVAVHTYSHRYEVVYQSVEAYFNDFNQMNELMKNKTGSDWSLFRCVGVEQKPVR